MERLSVESPASLIDALEAAPTQTRFIRRCAIAMQRNCESVSIKADGALLAIAFFQPPTARVREMALMIRPAAASHMRSLIRFAQLTLARLTQDGTQIEVHVWPDNRAGTRMARLAGFRHAGDTRWIQGGDHAVFLGPFRRQPEEAGDGSAPAAGDCQ